MRSSLGNGYDAIGPDGSSDICRRIVCQVPMNDDIIMDQQGLPHDSVTIGNREILSLICTLTGVSPTCLKVGSSIGGTTDRKNYFR